MPSLSGWQRYPVNLPSEKVDRLFYDHLAHDTRLKETSHLSLARERQTTRLQMRQLDASGNVSKNTVQIVSGGDQLDKYLDDAADFKGCRICTVPRIPLQNLLISEACLRKLCTFIGAFPPVLDLVHSFAETDGNIVHNGTPFATRTDSISKAVESTWLLQYVERNRRDGQMEPWSIRHVGVYIKSDQISNQHDVILFNPSRTDTFKAALDSIDTATHSVEHLKILLLASTTRNWRSYINYLEGRLNEMQSRIGHEYDSSIHITDMRKVQAIRRQLFCAKTAMNCNLQVLNSINRTQLDKVGTGASCPPASLLTPVDTTILHCKSELDALSTATSDLLAQIDGVAAFIGNILDYHAAQASRSSNEKAMVMQDLANKGNSLMIDMTKQSVNDARTLKTITILTLVYLPASFVAAFLGMGYLEVDNTQLLHLKCSESMYIFIVFTFVLLVATFGLWALFEVRHHMRERSKSALAQISTKA